MGNTVIENYEPPDKGWTIVLGTLRTKPEPKPEALDEPEEQEPEDRD